MPVTEATTAPPQTSEAIKAAIAEEIARREAADPVEKLKRDLAEAEAREAEDARRAKEAAQARQDAQTRQAFNLQAIAAGKLAEVIQVYVNAYSALMAAGDKARQAAAINPRARSDIRAPNIKALVGHEIARVAPPGPEWNLPPGGQWPTHSRDPRTVKPLADELAALARVIVP